MDSILGFQVWIKAWFNLSELSTWTICAQTSEYKNQNVKQNVKIQMIVEAFQT